MSKHPFPTRQAFSFQDHGHWCVLYEIKKDGFGNTKPVWSRLMSLDAAMSYADMHNGIGVIKCQGIGKGLFLEVANRKVKKVGWWK